MRTRTALTGLAALASVAAGQAPAHAATNVTVTVTFDISCFGCGTVTAVSSGTCYGYCEWEGAVCTGVCTFTNEEFVTVPSGPACMVNGVMSGAFYHWGGSTTFDLSWVYGGALVTTGSGGVGTGSFAVTSPVGNPCGGPATATFTGHIAGP